jgi:hypothetical protein
MLAEPPQQELGTTCVKNPPQHAQRNEKKKKRHQRLQTKGRTTQKQERNGDPLLSNSPSVRIRKKNKRKKKRENTTPSSRLNLVQL